MAFKLRSHTQGSLPLHNGGQGSFKKNPFSNIKSPLMAIDPVIDPTKKEKEKKEPTASEYEEIGRTVTTRRGEQDGVAGTFTDTNITERMDFEDSNIEVQPGQEITNLPNDEYIASLINSGIGREEALRRKLIDPSFADQFDLDYDQRNRLESSFAPDPSTPPVENPYTSYDTGYMYNTDFGTGGNLGRSGRTDDPAQAHRIIQRGENVSNSTNAKVERLKTSQQQGGSSGMADRDRINAQSEQGFVVGIRDEGDYDAYDNFGLGRLKGATPYGYRDGRSNNRNSAISKEFIAARDALRQKYKGQENRAEYENEMKAIKDKRDAQITAARSGKFYSSEMEQRFNDSHDTIYERKQRDGLFTEPTGGGRTGLIASPSETTINTGFLNTILSDSEKNTQLWNRIAERKEKIKAARLKRLNR